jgi:hypothetical protein
MSFILQIGNTKLTIDLTAPVALSFLAMTVLSVPMV